MVKGFACCRNMDHKIWYMLCVLDKQVTWCVSGV
jgi:hypothetical protein